MVTNEGQRTRTAVIGCGLAATDLHLPVLAALGDVELVAVCDADGRRAEAVGARFGAKPFTDVAALLAAGALESVHILTPPESHADLAEAAMAAGANVLIEKPFAYSLAEVERVDAAAKASGKRYSVIHNELFNAPVYELRARLKAGEIGEVCWVQYIAGRRDQTFVPETWYYETYGGRFGETLPHALCLLVPLLADLQVTHVDAHALGHTVLPKGFDVAPGPDELRVQLASATSNALASITYSLNANVPTSLIVAGTRGSLIARPFDDVVSLSDGKSAKQQAHDLVRKVQSRVRAKLGRPASVGVEDSSHYRQIRSYVTDLRSGAEFAVPPGDAREVVRLWQEIVGRYQAK